MLQTSGKPSSENVAGIVKLVYDDGSSKIQYIIMGKQLTYWWFSQLETDHSGIAWYGKNDISEGVGVSWCAIDNPEPHKKISKIIIEAAEGGTAYTVLGITLSNQKHYVPVKPTSFGGPDDWAAASCMQSLIEGLAGVTDNAIAYQQPVVAPRWTSANTDAVNVTSRFAASDAYVSYSYYHDILHKSIRPIATGNGKQMFFHVLMPKNVTVKKMLINNKPVAFKQSIIEQSVYADFTTTLNEIKQVEILY
ncbi:hypothetical protein BH10BAC2_BH10BAC2_48010 [soil metagenome]